ncbi:hypothetical protein E2C01_025446 [Portunus trituberculatus]|uniref:Uncharacterized protein n=1 Tax=Portunus trituberculatus TaxID=210409 RepID=A0A5B7EDB7_PORTR|nr:hypothetical protein [Portunus trituberculatus]
MPGDASSRLPYGATPGGHTSQVSMQAPFPMPRNFKKEASTYRSHKFCGRPLGLLHVGLSLLETT